MSAPDAFILLARHSARREWDHVMRIAHIQLIGGYEDRFLRDLIMHTSRMRADPIVVKECLTVGVAEKWTAAAARGYTPLYDCPWFDQKARSLFTGLLCGLQTMHDTQIHAWMALFQLLYERPNQVRRVATEGFAAWCTQHVAAIPEYSHFARSSVSEDHMVKLSLYMNSFLIHALDRIPCKRERKHVMRILRDMPVVTAQPYLCRHMASRLQIRSPYPTTMISWLHDDPDEEMSASRLWVEYYPRFVCDIVRQPCPVFHSLTVTLPSPARAKKWTPSMCWTLLTCYEHLCTAQDRERTLRDYSYCCIWDPSDDQDSEAYMHMIRSALSALEPIWSRICGLTRECQLVLLQFLGVRFA